MINTVPANHREEAKMRFRMLEGKLAESRRELELRKKDVAKLQTIMEFVRDAVILMLSDGSVASWNRGAEEMFGHSASEVVGKNLHELLMPERLQKAYKEAMAHFMVTGKGRAIGRTLELTARHKNGSEFPIELSLNSIHMDDQWIAVGIARDITERNAIETELKRANEKLRKLAMTDGLTGLANRHCLNQWLRREWQRAYREYLSISIILCDIDCFKQYNDMYGHHAGDACLRTVARIIQSCVKRPTDLVARYGGEEFMVVLPNTDAAGAEYLAESMRNCIVQNEIPHATSLVSPHVTISAGVAGVIPDRGIVPACFINTADAALYRAKRLGRNSVVVGELNPEFQGKPMNDWIPGYLSETGTHRALE